MSENVEDFKASRKLYHKIYGKLESRISSWRTNLKSGKKEVSFRRLIIPITICYNNDLAEIFTKKKQRKQQIYKVGANIDERKSKKRLSLKNLKTS